MIVGACWVCSRRTLGDVIEGRFICYGCNGGPGGRTPEGEAGPAELDDEAEVQAA